MRYYVLDIFFHLLIDLLFHLNELIFQFRLANFILGCSESSHAVCLLMRTRRSWIYFLFLLQYFCSLRPRVLLPIRILLLVSCWLWSFQIFWVTWLSLDLFLNNGCLRSKLSLSTYIWLIVFSFIVLRLRPFMLELCHIFNWYSILNWYFLTIALCCYHLKILNKLMIFINLFHPSVVDFKFFTLEVRIVKMTSFFLIFITLSYSTILHFLGSGKPNFSTYHYIYLVTLIRVLMQNLVNLTVLFPEVFIKGGFWVFVHRIV